MGQIETEVAVLGAGIRWIGYMFGAVETGGRAAREVRLAPEEAASER